jgi:DNA-binding FadR family transcriptional regulator
MWHIGITKKHQVMQPQKLSDQIAQQLEGMIADGTLRPGERLPAERQLSQNLGVSRPSLREAIQKLVSKGLVHTRQGGGNYVSQVLATSFSQPLLELIKDQPDTEFDTLEVRRELEGVAAFNAASRATAADRERIWAHYRSMTEVQRSNAAGIEKLRVDGDFHATVVESAHNVVLVHFMRAVREVLDTTVSDYLDLFYAEPKFVDKICRQHEEIVEAIMDKDPKAARDKSRFHVEFAFHAFHEFKNQAKLSRNSELYASMFAKSD